MERLKITSFKEQFMMREFEDNDIDNIMQIWKSKIWLLIVCFYENISKNEIVI